MKEILTLIRFLNDNLRNAIKNEVEGSSPERQARLSLISEITQGIGIVMGVSLLESLVKQLTNKYPHSGVSGDPSVPMVGKLRKWQAHLDLDPKWYGWQELANFVRIRHCFAHEFGNMHDIHLPVKTGLQNYLSDLKAGIKVDEKGITIQPYYEIKNDRIFLLNESTDRFRIISYYFVEQLNSKFPAEDFF